MSQFLVAALVLANSDYKLGFELGKRFGIVPAMLAVVVLYFGPYLLIKAIRNSRAQRRSDEQSRREDEAQRHQTSPDGPPRFNG